ncbi:MAG: GNAT family N-acetyltransferase [Pseudonocardiales bacterium]
MSVLRTGTVRLLDADDAGAVWEVLDRDPVGNVFVASRLRATGFEHWRLGAQLWGYVIPEGLESLCFYGANIIPMCATPAAVGAFAERALRSRRICSSIVGREESVGPLWQVLSSEWSPPRDVRTGQPLLVTSAPPAVPADPGVRRVRLSEFDTLMPACVAMYTEEVGVSPLGRDNGAGYRARVSELVAGGHSFARIEGGEVLFKAEIGATTGHTCQVQGVWVTPRMRGRGLGSAGTAAVVAEALRSVAPVVSLYVNSHNTAARRAYERVGFTRAGTNMSVLF